MAKGSNIKFVQTISAPVSAVYYAFTNQAAITQWLCSTAQVNLEEGGSFFFRWSRPKYFAVGEFQKIKPEKKLVFSWQGLGEPGVTKVAVTFEEENGSSTVTLDHKKIGEGSKWGETRKQIESGWEAGLENLKQVIEEGLDKRVYDQPFLGVIIAGVLSEEDAAEEGIDAQGGIRISGTVKGTGARAAGLRDQDVITKMAGVDTDSFPTLGQVLRDHSVGDTIEVTYFRDGEEHNTEMTLLKRPAPDVPTDPAELAGAVEELYEGLNKELGEICSGVSESIAGFSFPDAWNAKQIMAHLVTNEQTLQAWIASMVDNQYLTGLPNNPLPWIDAIADSSTLDELAKSLMRREAETVRLLANLPGDTVNRKATYFQIGFAALEFYPLHTQGHFNEMRQAINRAREESA